mgnify:CR=1 FL=1
MKKTLIAVAALSAMAASAMAANVTVSGVVDLGFNFQNVKAGDTTRTFQMKSGQNSGSRVMFKGAEDLGNNVEVGFQLESGFAADSGLLGGESNIFQRESRLYVKTAFGTLHAGRFGALDAGTGSVSIFGGSDMAAFGTGWSDVARPKPILKISSRYDNSIAYQSPTFAGVSLYVMHSLKESDQTKKFEAEDDGLEGRPSANRYNGIGVKYVNGAFNAAFVASQQNYKSESVNPENGLVYSLGAGYDFGVCKVMAEGQYFDMGKDNVPNSDVEKGWGTVLSVTAPVAGGKLYASAGYKDAENTVVSEKKQKAFNLGLGYTYNFSKRTMFYTAAGYEEVKDEVASSSSKTKTTTVITGLVHKF